MFPASTAVTFGRLTVLSRLAGARTSAFAARPFPGRAARHVAGNHVVRARSNAPAATERFEPPGRTASGMPQALSGGACPRCRLPAVFVRGPPSWLLPLPTISPDVQQWTWRGLGSRAIHRDLSRLAFWIRVPKVRRPRRPGSPAAGPLRLVSTCRRSQLRTATFIGTTSVGRRFDVRPRRDFAAGDGSTVDGRCHQQGTQGSPSIA